jgi:3-hydroxy-3-methylglutaryl CoA synthase
MSIAVSRDIAASPNVGLVFQGNKTTAVKAEAQHQTTLVPSGSGVRSDAQVLSMLDQQEAQKRTIYDQPKQRHQQALAAYEMFANQDKREKIQQMFSLDLYA